MRLLEADDRRSGDIVLVVFDRGAVRFVRHDGGSFKLRRTYLCCRALLRELATSDTCTVARLRRRGFRGPRRFQWTWQDRVITIGTY